MICAEKIPLVTIGITTFNAELTVARAVTSAVQQTWPRCEIIVVDDASSDGTWSKLMQWGGIYPQMKIIRTERNSGVACSRNTIINLAKGDFIVFFDDDDVSRPDRVFKQIARIVEYEKSFAGGAPVICHTARSVRYQHTAVSIQTMGEVPNKTAPNGLRVAQRILVGTPLRDGYGACASCSQCARTEVYRLFGGFDCNFRRSEDTELNVRLAVSGAHFVGISEALVEQEMTHGSDKSLAIEHHFTQKMLEKHQSLFASRREYKFARRWLTLKFYWQTQKRRKLYVEAVFLFSLYPTMMLKRFWWALRNYGLNRNFVRFYNA